MAGTVAVAAEAAVRTGVLAPTRSNGLAISPRAKPIILARGTDAKLNTERRLRPTPLDRTHDQVIGPPPR